MNFQYAAQIAKDWNAVDSASGFCGFVTEFDVDSQYLSKFEVQNVGGFEHNELWIPSEDLTEFNKKIDGNIRVTSAWYGKNYTGEVNESGFLSMLHVGAQWNILLDLMANPDPDQKIREGNISIQANWGWWKLHHNDEPLFQSLTERWKKLFPHRPFAEQVELCNQ